MVFQSDLLKGKVALITGGGNWDLSGHRTGAGITRLRCRHHEPQA